MTKQGNSSRALGAAISSAALGAVIGAAALFALAGIAILVKQHDEWEVAERRYPSEELMAIIDAGEATIEKGVLLAIVASHNLVVELTPALVNCT